MARHGAAPVPRSSATVGAPGPAGEIMVLLVEDDPTMATVVATALDASGYRVEVARHGAEGLRMASALEPQIVVLDLELPDIDGIEVCRQLRRWMTDPIVVLSADGAEDRKVQALDEGADDYVTKPFSMSELLARLRVALRHRQAALPARATSELRIGDLVIDEQAHRVLVGSRPVDFTRKELALLAALARQPGRVLTHGALLEQVWGGDRPGGVESLRVHVTQLRKKLGSGSDRPELRSEPGVGYRLALPETGHE